MNEFTRYAKKIAWPAAALLSVVAAVEPASARDTVISHAIHTWGATAHGSAGAARKKMWIQRLAQELKASPGIQIVLAGGSLPQNIYWATIAAARMETRAKSGKAPVSRSLAMKAGVTGGANVMARNPVVARQIISL